MDNLKPRQDSVCRHIKWDRLVVLVREEIQVVSCMQETTRNRWFWAP